MKKIFFIPISFILLSIFTTLTYSNDHNNPKNNKKYFSEKTSNKNNIKKQNAIKKPRKRYRRYYKKRKKYSYKYNRRRSFRRRSLRRKKRNNSRIRKEYIEKLIRKITLNNNSNSKIKKVELNYNLGETNKIEKQDLLNNINFKLNNIEKAVFSKNYLNSSSNKLASIYIKASPKQGETIALYIKSPYKIEKCFGSIAGKKIQFFNIKNHNIFRGYVGFDIQHHYNSIKVVIGVLLKNGKITFLEKKLNIAKRGANRYIWVRRYGYKRITVKYKKRVKDNGKLVWKTFFKKKRIRYRRLVKILPPTLVKKAKPKDIIKKELANKFKQKIETKTPTNLYTNKKDIGFYALDNEPDSSKKSYTKNNYISKTENRSFKYYYKKSLPYKLWSGAFLQPTYPNKRGRISSKFGVYRVFRLRRRLHRGYHKGLDIAMKRGEPIYAPNYGVVVVAKYFKTRGNVVMIDHGLGVMTSHLHLSKINVKKGMFVKKGQLIGKVGSTGRSTGPHLHWEVRVNGVSVDSTQWRNNKFTTE